VSASSLLPALATARAHELIDSFASRRITVVGDVMLDRFLIGRVGRISPEAPVPVVVFENEEFRLGGAANVANNLRQLGAAVDLIGMIGDDESGSQLKQELAAIDDHRPMLILGKELSRFLQERRQRGKQSCGPGRIYCIACREPKVPAGNMADCIPASPSAWADRLRHHRIAILKKCSGDAMYF